MEQILKDKLHKKIRFGDTEVFCGSGIIDNIPPTVADFCSEGLTGVVYSQRTVREAERLAESLKSEGIKIRVVRERDVSQLPEYTRFAIAVGSGGANRATGEFCKAHDIDYALLLCAPTVDRLLCGFQPKQVFIDENILLKAPPECIAAGRGCALAAQVDAFEEAFINQVTPEKSMAGAVCEWKCDANGSLSQLAVELLDLSFRKRRDSASDVMAQVLASNALKRGEKPRLFGEYKFLSAMVLAEFYASYLKSPAIDVMPPCNYDRGLDRLSYITGTEREKLVKRIDIYDVNSYFRINYILGEYRTDLINRLGATDVHSAQRQWRRLYPDAGYWMKSALTSRRMTEALALAGLVSDGLLGYAARTGFTESFY